jgi:hypothetical protein
LDRGLTSRSALATAAMVAGEDDPAHFIRRRGRVHFAGRDFGREYVLIRYCLMDEQISTLVAKDQIINHGSHRSTDRVTRFPE